MSAFYKTKALPDRYDGKRSITQEEIEMANLDIHKRYTLPHTPQAVFDAWVSPDSVIAPVTGIEIEPKQGGLFKLTVAGESDAHMIGRFLQFDRPNKLVYTWEWNHDGEESQVDVTFTALDKGTEVAIHHTGFEHDTSRDSHDRGWDSYIEGIQALLNVS